MGKARSIDYKTTAAGDVLRMHAFDAEGEQVGRAGVLFFHGGGWSGGEPEQFFPHCRELARRGYVAMSADYRVKGRHGTTPMEAVADARSCVRWVVGHAEELGLDTGRLVLAGGSAGGHLALMSLLTAAYDDPGEDLSVMPAACGLVLFNPVSDCGPEGYGYGQLKDHLEYISPLHAMKEPLPPVLIMSGQDDPTTTIQIQRAFRDKAVSLGGKCELIEYAGQKHGFFNYGEGQNPYYTETLRELIRFVETVCR